MRYRGGFRAIAGIDGFTSLVTLLPQDGMGMVILTNKEETGRPIVHLEPRAGGGFVIRENRTLSIAFTEDAQGNVTGARLNQPAGVYSLTKKK